MMVDFTKYAFEVGVDRTKYASDLRRDLEKSHLPSPDSMTGATMTPWTRRWWTVPRRVAAFTITSGVAFLVSMLCSPSLTFQQLPPHAFPSSFHDRRGFFQVLRWLEQLDSGEQLARFLSVLQTFQGQRYSEAVGIHTPRQMPIESGERLLRTADELVAHVTRIVAWELSVQMSKMGLQCGLLLFLYRHQAISKRAMLPSVCLSMLVVICTRMAQSCILELLLVTTQKPRLPDQHNHPPEYGPDQGRSEISGTHLARMRLTAAFLGVVFLLRFLAVAIVNAVLGRAYQIYFGGCPTQWKRMPGYIGSKHVMLTTMFGTVATVSVMVISSSALRSLSEASLLIESIALVSAFSHFVYQFAPANVKVTKK